MFTLKLYRSGPLQPRGCSVIMEVAGIWIVHRSDGVKCVQAFKKTVGIMDEDGPHDFYVGGDHEPAWQCEDDKPTGAHPSAITPDNYYSWGVLENAQGKTTEMIR